MMTESKLLNARRIAPALAAVLAILSSPAAAQSESSGGKRDLIVTVGGGGQFYARYPGADKSDFFPMPIFNWRHEGEPIALEAADEGIGFSLLGDDSPIGFGPAIQFQNSRRDKDVGAPVGKVGFTVEAGAFVQAWLGRSVRLRAEGRRGLGGHEGWIGDVSADLVGRSGDTTIWSVGPRLRLSSARYQRAYFGLTPAAATATGLPVYRPGSGVHAIGASSSLTHQFDDHWGIHAYAGYDRLVGDAADSPLVRRYGSRDQLSGGLGLSYSFRIRRGRD